MLDPARQAAAYQNEPDNNVPSEPLKRMVAAGLEENGVADVTEFMKTLETFKPNCVRDKCRHGGSLRTRPSR